MAKESKSSAALGNAIDAIGKMKLQLLPLEAKVSAMKKKIDEAENKLLARVQKSKLDGASGKIARAVVDKDEIPRIDDYEALSKWIKKKDAFDLLQKRISKEAWKLRVDEGIKVPGVSVFNKVSLKVALIRKSR